MANELLNTDALAAELGLAPITLRKLRMRGDGPPFVKVGRSVRYRADDVRAWLSARTHNRTAVPAEAEVG